MLEELLKEYNITETKKKKFLQALLTEEAIGNISQACKRIGLSRKSVYNWRNSDIAFDKAVKTAVWNGKESIADLAEQALVKRIKSGDTTAIIFTLKSLRRDYYYDQRSISPLTTDKVEQDIFTTATTEREKELTTNLLSMYYKYKAEKMKVLSKEELEQFEVTIEKMISAGAYTTFPD